MASPYSRAWKKWITSKSAIRLMELMGPASIYNENRLREAFDAGWCAAQDVWSQHRNEAMTPPPPPRERSERS